MLSLIFMVLGGAGLAASFYVPHRDNFTSEHAGGAAAAGVLFLIGCFILAVRSL